MKKKQIISIIISVIGLITLVIGGVFLITKLTSGPKIQDGEYLVSVSEFSREDEPEVVWRFTEIGKGTLTTNNHLNDYDFIWALEGDVLKIETEWLLTINNEYRYRIDNGNLILVSEDSGEIKLVPTSSINPEVTEDNELVVGD